MSTSEQRAMPRLVVVGASARAAAFSAIRAGFAPEAIDLFADADLREHVPAARVSGFSSAGSDAEIAARLRDDVPWIYTGGLENRPELVETLAARAPLWGNRPEVLRALRRPTATAERGSAPAAQRDFPRVADVLAASGAVVPAEAELHELNRLHGSHDLRQLPADLSAWLVKPRASAGGKSILRGDDAWREVPGLSAATHYLQERIEGKSAAAVFVGDGASCWYLGATQQLVGEEWLGARPFAWCGNIGPLELDERSCGHLCAVGGALVTAFGLRGLFGVDFIVRDTDGAIVPIEVNPRYPASVEILEHALGAEALALHAAAFQPDLESSRKTEKCPPRKPPRAARRAAGTICGKAILYAPRPFRIEVDLLRQFPSEPNTFPVVADIPAPGTDIATRQPICTVFAMARTCEGCVTELRRLATEVRAICNAR